jgi:cytochrome c-type biogenesis protein CcmF
MGVGPALPWKSASREEIRNKLIPPAIGAALMTIIAFVAGMRSVYGTLAFAFVGYAAMANLREYWIGVRARRTAHGEAWGTALVRLVNGNRRRYGGYVAHLGIFLVALGITASQTFRSEREATLKPGESMMIDGRSVKLRDVWGREERQRGVIGATLDISVNGETRGSAQPRMNFYPTSQTPIPTPDVQSSIFGDFYFNLESIREDGSAATVKVIHEPLVPWIWFGGLVVVIGALIGMAPGGRGREPRPTEG